MYFSSQIPKSGQYSTLVPSLPSPVHLHSSTSNLAYPNDLVFWLPLQCRTA